MPRTSLNEVLLCSLEVVLLLKALSNLQVRVLELSWAVLSHQPYHTIELPQPVVHTNCKLRLIGSEVELLSLLELTLRLKLLPLLHIQIHDITLW